MMVGRSAPPTEPPLGWRFGDGGRGIGVGALSRPGYLICAVLGTVSFLAITALAITSHQAFATGRHDLEIYSQVAWSLANGSPFETTLLRTNTLHLAEHLALVLLPLGPLFGLMPDPRLLILLQQIALTLSALAAGSWAIRRLGQTTGTIALAAFLLNPVLASIALDDFHAVVLGTLPITVGLTLTLAGYPRSGSLLLLGAALMEEEAALAAVGLGLLLLARRPRPLGAGLLAGGAAFLTLAALVVMPAFHHPRTLGADSAVRAAGHFSMFRAQPGVAVERLLGARGQEALVDFILPSGGAALLAPELLAAGLPTFAALWLQDRDDTFTRHWSAPILPAIWLATATGLVALRGRARVAGRALLVVGTASSYALASPLPGGGAFNPARYELLSQVWEMRERLMSVRGGDGVRGQRQAALERAVALAPVGVPTIASGNLATHLAARRELYVYAIDDHYAAALGYENRAVDAYILDFDDPATQRVQPLSKASPLLASPPFVVHSTSRKVLVLTRGAPEPKHALAVMFDRRMALWGYDLDRSAESVRLTLHWQGLSNFSGDFRRIVALLDSEGRTLAEDSDLELTRILPTQKWEVGQRVLDEVELAIPAGAGTGLRARVLWQNRDRRTPMPLPDGSTSLEIAI